MFADQDVSVTIPFIHTLVPRVFQLLTQLSDSVSLSAVAITKPTLDVVLESLELVQSLVDKAADSKSCLFSRDIQPSRLRFCRRFAGLQLLSIYIPILISFLSDDPDVLRGKSGRSLLHSDVLQRLLVMAPKYPTEFRTIVNQVPRLKSRLEAAIRSQQQQQQAASLTRSPGLAVGQSGRVRPGSMPSIQLKTDFSNFARSS